MTVPLPYPLFAGLSCYTANLGCYLAAEWPGTEARLAGSVRLAVRTDLPDGELAFSHHRQPLDRLPDGSVLRYAAAPPATTLAAATAELDRHGRVLLVVDNARLPWSPSCGSSASAPHWLLVHGRQGDRWDVLDQFAGLLPGGEQRPHAGRLGTAELLAALRPAAPWSAAQHRRNTLAFGLPVPVPPGPTWLRRTPPGGADPAGANHGRLAGRWAGDGEALGFLTDHLLRSGGDAVPYLDDLWSAAGHHVFRYRWLARTAAGADRERLDALRDAWQRLPSALRFAVDSARRGRARPALVRRTLEELDRLEQDHRRRAGAGPGVPDLRPADLRSTR